MDSNTTPTLVFEMRVLNELRKFKPEQRKELMETLEREEKLEEEALKKNPNLHVDNKLSQLLNELKDLRTEVQVLKNRQCPMLYNQSECRPIRLTCPVINQVNDEEESNSGECSLFSIDWWPILIFIFIFLTLLSIPSKSRPCPINL